MKSLTDVVKFHWVFYLTFLWYVSGFKGWAYLNPMPQWSKPYHFSFSPRGIKSPDVPVTGSRPVGVGVLSHQYVWGRVSSNSRSRTQASRGGSSSNIQKTANLYTAQDSSRPQSAGSAPYSTYGAVQPQRTSGTAVSSSNSQIPSRFSSMSGWAPSQFVSTQRGSGPSSSRSVSSQNIPPYAVISSAQSPPSLSNRDLSSFRQYTFASQGPESQLSVSSKSSAYGSSSLQFQGTPGSPQYVRMSEATIQNVPTSQSQMPPKWWSSGIQTFGTSLGTSHSSTSPQNSRQSQTIPSQYTPISPTYAKHGSSPLGVSSQSLGDQSSQSRAGGQMATSRHYVSAQQGGMPQDTPGQHGGWKSLGGHVPVASPYRQGTPNGFPQFQNWKPSASGLTQSAQTLGIPVSQSSLPSQHSQIPSRLSSASSVGSQSLFVSTQESSSSSSSSPHSESISCPFMPRRRFVSQV